MLRIARFSARQIDGLGSYKLDVCARGVEVRVVGHHVALLAHHVEQDALSGAALVRGDDVPISEDFLDGVAEVVEASASGVAFVAFHDARPLMGRHRAGAGIGQQVDEHVIGRKQEEVIVCGAQQFFPLLAGCPADRLDALNTKRFDDGFGRHRRNPSRL